MSQKLVAGRRPIISSLVLSRHVAQGSYILQEEHCVTTCPPSADQLVIHPPFPPGFCAAPEPLLYPGNPFAPGSSSSSSVWEPTRLSTNRLHRHKTNTSSSFFAVDGFFSTLFSERDRSRTVSGSGSTLSPKLYITRSHLEIRKKKKKFFSAAFPRVLKENSALALRESIYRAGSPSSEKTMALNNVKEEI